MTTPIYADAAALAAYTGTTAPANHAVLLRRASSLVADAIRAKVYDVDSEGLPIDTAQRETLEEATCAQAAAWAANDINPLAGRAGARKDIASKAGGGVTVQYASYADDAKARSDLASGDVLISEALRVLANGGMLTTAVQARL